MISIRYGSFDGNSWEELMQLVFKAKYGNEQYQEMKASPGDFGIEGFTKSTGLSFQCYCPDTKYTQRELYEKQRDKITKDLGKLKKYEEELKKRLGNTKLKEWVFVIPEAPHNDLLAHAQTKQEEVISWKLSIIDSNFKVLIKDADFFSREIYDAQLHDGKKLTFFSHEEIKNTTEDQSSVNCEKNIFEKNKIRCTVDGRTNDNKHAKLNTSTTKKYLESDLFLKKIEQGSPKIYHMLMRAINQYENEVEEQCLTYTDSPNSLVDKVKYELTARLEKEVAGLDGTEINRLSDLTISKWIALCPLSFE